MSELRFIFGGTFDPIHLGHTAPLKQVARVFGINRISLMPNKIPAHKSKATATEQQRLEMLNRVCQDDALFTIERYELETSDISYTANTLATLSSFSNKHKIVFIMGADSWLSFESWHCYKELAENYHFIVLDRPPLEQTSSYKDDLDASLAKVANNLGISSFWVSTTAKDQVSLAQQAWSDKDSSVTFCKFDLLDVSSSEIRSIFKHGNDFADNELVDHIKDRLKNKLSPSVLDYIVKQNIYS
jgi:nicotinate-nucleotide adenylyltransferase